MCLKTVAMLMYVCSMRSASEMGREINVSFNLQDSSFIWIHISDYYLSLKPQSSNILFEQWVVGSLNNHCASHVSILTNLCRTELWHPIQKASFLCNHSSKSHEIFTKYRWIVIYLTCQTASIFIFIFKSY